MTVPLEDAFSHVVAITKMRPRGNGFGVKGSSHTVFWPKYDDYKLGVLIGMTYGDGNLIKRSTGLRTGRWRVEFCEGDLYLVEKYARLTKRLFNIVPRIRDRETWYEVYYSSRIAYEFLTSSASIRMGRKPVCWGFPMLQDCIH